MADIEEVLAPLESLAAAQLERVGGPYTRPADGVSIGELRRWATDQPYHSRVAAGVAIGCAYIRRLQSVNDDENGQASTAGVIVTVARVSEWGAVLRLLEHGAAVEVERLEEVFPDALRGYRHRKRNPDIARRPRRPDMAKIIQRLAATPGDSGELWPALWDALDREGMDPEEITTPSGDLQYQYHDRQGKLQTISKRRFATRLSESRKPQ